MKCPICEGKTKVINSRGRVELVRRLRECKECLTRFTTYEKIEIESIPKYIRETGVKITSPHASWF